MLIPALVIAALSTAPNHAYRPPFPDLDKLDRQAEALFARYDALCRRIDAERAREAQQQAEWAAQDAEFEKTRRWIMDQVYRQKAQGWVKSAVKALPPALKKP